MSEVEAPMEACNAICAFMGKASLQVQDIESHFLLFKLAFESRNLPEGDQQEVFAKLGKLVIESYKRELRAINC